MAWLHPATNSVFSRWSVTRISGVSVQDCCFHGKAIASMIFIITFTCLSNFHSFIILLPYWQHIYHYRDQQKLLPLVKCSLIWRTISVHQIPLTSLCHWRGAMLAQFYRYISFSCSCFILENFWLYILSQMISIVCFCSLRFNVLAQRNPGNWTVFTLTCPSFLFLL